MGAGGGAREERGMPPSPCALTSIAFCWTMMGSLTLCYCPTESSLELLQDSRAARLVLFVHAQYLSIQLRPSDASRSLSLSAISKPIPSLHPQPTTDPIQMTLPPSTKPTPKSTSSSLPSNKRPSHKHQLSEVFARRGEDGWLEDAPLEHEHTEQEGGDEEERERPEGMTVDLGRLVEHAGEMRGPFLSSPLLSFHPIRPSTPLPTSLLLLLPISLSGGHRTDARGKSTSR